MKNKMFEMEDSVHENSFTLLNNKKRKSTPKRSKLESYLDILKALIHNGPLKSTHIKQKNNFSSSSTEENLIFLINLNLVEKTFERGQNLFSITIRGIRVLTYFGEPTGLLSVLQTS